MRFSRLLPPTTIALAMACAASAAPPEGKGGGKDKGGENPPADFIPEILYKSDRQKYEDIIFANREGDQAVLVYRGSKSVGSGFSASSNSEVSPQPNMITWSDGETAFITYWTEDSGFLLGSQNEIHSFVGGRPTGLTFSNADDAIAMSNGSRGLYIYDIPANDIGGGSITQHISEDFIVYKARWSPDDNSLYFFGGPDDGQSSEGLFRYDLDFGNPVKLIDRQAGHHIYLDVAHPAAGETLIATTLDGFLQMYDGNGAPVQLLSPLAGDNFVFNCDASAVLHRAADTRQTTLAISHLSGGTTIWAEGRVQPIADWMPREPCE